MRRLSFVAIFVIGALLVQLGVSLNNERLRENAIVQLTHYGWDLKFSPLDSSLPVARRLWFRFNNDYPLDHCREVIAASINRADGKQLSAAYLLKYLPDVKGLYVPNTDALSGEFFFFASKLPRLKRLYLDGSNVSDEMLSSFSSASNIESLSVVATTVSGHSLYKYTSLNELVVHDSDFNDEGVQAVASASSLSTLDLEQTKITPISLVHLVNMKSLKKLGLSERFLNENGKLLEKFRSERPDVEIAQY